MIIRTRVPGEQEIRDNAVGFATRNRLVARTARRDWSDFTRDDMLVSADEIAAWLAQATDRADYERRCSAIRAVLSMGGVDYESDYRRYTATRRSYGSTCGAPLVRAATEVYEFIVNGERPTPTSPTPEPATA